MSPLKRVLVTLALLGLALISLCVSKANSEPERPSLSPTHKHWVGVLKKLDKKDQGRSWKKVFKKCLETATGFEEYLINADLAKSGSKEQRQSLENALASAKRKTEVKEVLKRVEPGSDLEARAWQKILKMEEELKKEQLDLPPADKVGDLFWNEKIPRL